jgi:hypothetical protein
MKNIVNELDVLRNSLSTEEALREAANTEWANIQVAGPMMEAHDASIKSVLLAAKRLIEKSEET